MRATTIPVGMPLGNNIFLPIISAIIIRVAPINMEVGKHIFALEPTSILEICGDIRPKKDIAPAIATEIEAKAIEINSKIIFSLFTLTPILKAVSSLSKKVSIILIL